MLPFVTMGSCPNQVDSLKSLNAKLVKALLETKRGQTINKAHKGISLGKTVVSGGVYGNISLGISGSIHWNSALSKKQELQLEVFTTMAKIIQEAFGDKPWFKNWMEFYDKRPWLLDYLIPGTPCTSLWWSYDDRPFNAHKDWNTYGAAILSPKTFCSMRYAEIFFRPKRSPPRGKNDLIRNIPKGLFLIVHISTTFHHSKIIKICSES